MQYRLYQSDDFIQLYAIEEVCFQPPFRFGRRYMRSLVASPNSITWIAEDEGAMAGFSIIEWGHTNSEVAAYIQTIEVLPIARARGIGAELLRRVEDSVRSAGAQSIWLHVDSQNSGAVRLYERHGYTCEGRKENYYAHGRAALIYRKPVPASS